MLNVNSVWNRLGNSLLRDMGPLMAIIVVYLLWRYNASRLDAPPKIRQSPEKKKATKFGSKCSEPSESTIRFTFFLIPIEAWKPVHFNYPTITLLPTDPLTMKPIPYRPFRAGEYPFVLCAIFIRRSLGLQARQCYDGYPFYGL
jgi:hypothetical protein